MILVSSSAVPAATSSDFLSFDFEFSSLRVLPALLDVFREVHIKYNRASEMATMIPTPSANRTFYFGCQS